MTQNKLLIGNGTDSISTDTNLHWDTTNDRLGINTATPGYTLDINGTINTSTSYYINSIETYKSSSIEF